MNIDKIEGSPSLEIVNLVLNKKAKGENVLSLAIGDPSSDTPREIVDAAYKSMISGEVHYTSSYGTQEVRNAIRSKVRKKNDIKSELSNCIFLTTKFSVYAALVALSSDPFEALVPDPGYFYSEPVVLAGGIPVRYRLAKDFSLDTGEIKKKCSEKTKAILLNTPSNPTGKVLEKSELIELYEFCKDRKIYVISDEAYEDLVYEKNHFSIGSLESNPDIVVSLFSLSKSYSMTGWRAGYAVASEQMIYLINKFLENTITSFPTFVQNASAYALNNCDNYIQQFKEEYRRKRKLLLEKLHEIDELSAGEIDGAFYAFPRYRKNLSSVELCRKILENEGVALLPGLAFGPAGEGHIRFSFSGSEEIIEKGMKGVKSFFSTNF